MKGLPGFGPARRRRFSMQYGYAPRPSFWLKVRSNAHLIIAAVGTMSLVSLASMAMWLAMPSNNQPAFAEGDKSAGDLSAPLVVADTGPVAADAAGLARTANEPAVAEIAGQDADSSALKPGDPRWSAPGTKAASQQTTSKQATQQAFAPQKVDPAAAAAVTAEALNDGGQDSAKTSAIPTARPDFPDADATADGSTETGHILRAVTMRSGPKKSASALGTVPAKTAVKVMSCKSWCQIVYKGRQGWIYKSFLKRGG